MLNQSAESTQALMDKANALGMVLSDKAVNDSIKFKDTLDTLQRSMNGFGMSLGAELLPEVQKLADELIVHLPEIKSNLIPVFNILANILKFVFNNFQTISIIAGVVLNTMIAFKTLSYIVTLWKSLSAIIQIAGMKLAIFNAIANVNPIFLIASAVGIAITSLIALEMKTQAISKSFRVAYEMVKIFVDWLKQVPANFRAKIRADIEERKLNKEKLPKYASGTNFASGGLSLVGEAGAELVDLPKGAKVFNNSETKKMLNNNAVININIAGNVIGNHEFINQLKTTLGQQLATALAR